MIRCWLACRRGDAREAIIWGERAKETVGRLAENVFSGLADAHLGGAYLEAGEPGRALAHLLAAGDAGAPLEHSVRCWWEVLVTRAQLATGRVDEARAWAERATESAKTMGLPARLGWARYARAAVLLADGDAAAAVVGARESVALCSESRDPIGAARARILLGQALAAAGQPAEAGAELEHARGTSAAAGRRARGRGGARAPPAEHRVARTRGRGTAGADVASLSARERGSPARGRREDRQEIAAELFLAPDDGNHLSRVSGKLGVAAARASPGHRPRDCGGLGQVAAPPSAFEKASQSFSWSVIQACRLRAPPPTSSSASPSSATRRYAPGVLVTRAGGRRAACPASRARSCRRWCPFRMKRSATSSTADFVFTVRRLASSRIESASRRCRRAYRPPSRRDRACRG